MILTAAERAGYEKRALGGGPVESFRDWRLAASGRAAQYLLSHLLTHCNC